MTILATSLLSAHLIDIIEKCLRSFDFNVVFYLYLCCTRLITEHIEPDNIVASKSMLELYVWEEILYWTALVEQWQRMRLIEVSSLIPGTDKMFV